MSASEKLRALTTFDYLGPDANDMDGEAWGDSVDVDALVRALPQIVGVVEAHQRLADEVQRSLKVIPEPIPANAGAGELRLFEFCVDSHAALSALDKALTGAKGDQPVANQDPHA